MRKYLVHLTAAFPQFSPRGLFSATILAKSPKSQKFPILLWYITGPRTNRSLENLVHRNFRNDKNAV